MSKQPPDAVVKEFSLLPKVTNTTMAQWLNVSQVINGGIAGIVGVSIVFPLDLVKVFCLKKWFGYLDILWFRCGFRTRRLEEVAQRCTLAWLTASGRSTSRRWGRKKGKLHNFCSRDSLACTEVAQSI